MQFATRQPSNTIKITNTTKTSHGLTTSSSSIQEGNQVLLSGQKLIAIPDGIITPSSNVQQLVLDFNDLMTLPPTISQLKSLIGMHTHFPFSISNDHSCNVI
jgi:hypothetical protein